MLDSGYGRYTPKGQRRQVVLNGPVAVDGTPNALSVIAGGIQLNASGANPVTVSFAAGFGSAGAIEYYQQITTNLALPLAGTGVGYIYVDHNVGTGVVTIGLSNQIPEYSVIAPTFGLTADKHWFNPVSYEMRRWDGSAWLLVQRVFIGQVALNAGVVTSLITYAYGGFYQSSSQSHNTSNWVTFNHNLGVPISLCSITVLNSSGSPTSVGDMHPLPAMSIWDTGGRGYYGEPVGSSFPLNRCAYTLYVRGFLVPLGGGLVATPTWQTNGLTALIVSRLF